ncbi:hypothetical protein DOFOFD_11620 [Acetobacteraceae bacterium EV16P]|uniref:Uncharacterized protein n=1 Tax=Sorlinia euscelidii TaxID=3081148 RepID=A0ABU7U556_9PROT
MQRERHPTDAVFRLKQDEDDIFLLVSQAINLMSESSGRVDLNLCT